MFRVVVLVCLATVCSARLVSGSDINKFEPHGIVNGVDTNIANYPYQVSVQVNKRHICGGSIISRSWVLTAAHCTVDEGPKQLSVRVGSTVRNAGGQVHAVRRKIEHYRYNDITKDYDYALLEVSPPFVYGRNVAPIRLPASNQRIPAGTLATFTGWGHLKENGPPSQILQVVVIPIVSDRSCQDAYGGPQVVTDRMICAGLPEGGVDTCQGDSGGPMVVETELIGVSSWGNGCARRGFPGIYSKVSRVRYWIQTYTGI